jgi:hypothetical protein
MLALRVFENATKNLLIFEAIHSLFTHNDDQVKSRSYQRAATK